MLCSSFPRWRNTMALQLKPTCNNLQLLGWNTLLCSLDGCGCNNSQFCRYIPEYPVYNKKDGSDLEYPIMEFEHVIFSTPKVQIQVKVTKPRIRLTAQPLYSAWFTVKDRCTNPNNPSYEKCQGLLWEPWLDPWVFFDAFPEYVKGDRFRRLNPALGFNPENYCIKTKS